jgi:hypothetical protein
MPWPLNLRPWAGAASRSADDGKGRWLGALWEPGKSFKLAGHLPSMHLLLSRYCKLLP